MPENTTRQGVRNLDTPKNGKKKPVDAYKVCKQCDGTGFDDYDPHANKETVCSKCRGLGQVKVDRK